eukprot:5961700-Pyramimonas_sp.AAC.1
MERVVTHVTMNHEQSRFRNHSWGPKAPFHFHGRGGGEGVERREDCTLGAGSWGGEHSLKQFPMPVAAPVSPELAPMT